MEPLQKQVVVLSNKVDALYQVVDQLSVKVSDALSECRLTPIPDSKEGVDGTGRSLNSNYSLARQSLEHKDILVDNNDLDNHIHSSERELSPEIQIQRLTAQLTAAYNRIAALEEQLLARRLH